MLLPFFSIWVSLGSSVLHEYPEFLSILRVVFPLLTVLPTRRKPLGTGYHSDHSEAMSSPKSMSVRKWRSHLQTTRGFGIFPFIPPLFNPGLPLFYLLCMKDFTKFSSQLDESWPLIFRMPITIGCDDSGVSEILILKNTSPAKTGKNASSSHLISKSSLDSVNSSRSTFQFVRKVLWMVQFLFACDYMSYLSFLII